MPYEYPDGLIPVTAGWTKNNPADHTVMGVNNDLHGGIKPVPSIEDMLAIHPNYLGKGYTVCFVAGRDGLKSRLFELTSDPSLATGTVMDDWTEWEVGGTSVSPDGIVQHGTVTQSFNDLTLNTDWKWRHSNIVYSNPQSHTVSIPPPAEGFTRIDLIAGTKDNTVIRISGTAAALPAVAVPPDLAEGRVALVTAFVTDAGIAGFQEFALASFVRFDTGNQGLAHEQRKNALKNIQAVSSEDVAIKYNTLDVRHPEDNRRIVLSPGGGLSVYSMTGIARFNVRMEANSAGFGSGNPMLMVRSALNGGTRTVVNFLDHAGEYLFSLLNNGTSHFSRHAPVHPDATDNNQSATLGQVKSIITGGVPVDGITRHGSFTQIGNSLRLGQTLAWEWQIDGVPLLSSATTIPVPVPDPTHTRIDVIVGDASGALVLVLGEQSMDAAVPPAIPPSAVGIMEVFSSDTGLSSYKTWALGSFIRYDTAAQGLTLTQRQNARTNIQAISRDTNDQKTGILTFKTADGYDGIRLDGGNWNKVQLRNDSNFVTHIMRTTAQVGIGITSGYFTIHARQPETNRNMLSILDHNGNNIFGILNGGLAEFGKQAPTHPPASKVDQSLTLGQFKKTTKTVTASSYNVVNLDLTEKLLFTSASPVNVRIRTVLDSDSRFEFRQMGLGQLSIIGAGSGEIPVHILVKEGYLPKTAGRYSAVWLDWVGENTWLLYGDLEKVNP